MKSAVVSLLVVATLFGSLTATAEGACPRTVGSKSLGPPFPDSSHWYGSESFAVQLPPDGTWPTTAPGARIAVKLFWWSAGFKPGMELNLIVTLKELNGAAANAVVSRATNAHAESLGGWTMLTGIDFPEAGCWEITGRYLGQELKFVVETVRSAPRGSA
jgi:hypothetical protein